MFEGAFEKLGRTSAKHSGKVIIFWIVLLIVLTPFASLLFSETSYDLGGSITPANSMANAASNLQSTYFGGNGTAGTNQSMVIVTTGTYVNQTSGFSAILNSQNKVSSYLSSQGISSNFTSITDIENSTLSGVGLYVSTVLNGTYPLVSSINAQTVELNQTVNGMNFTVFGLPAIYSATYQASNATTAYGNTISALQSASLGPLLPVALIYFNTFANYLNNTGTVNPTTISSCINETIFAPSGNNFTSLALSNATRDLYGLAASLALNFTFQQSAMPTYRDAFNAFVNGLVISQVSAGLASNNTVSGFISNQLNTPITNFVNRSYNLGSAPLSWEIANLSDSFVVNGTANYFAGSPLININVARLPGFVKEVNDSIKNGVSVNTTVSQIISSQDFSSFAAVPAGYVYHQFVGYDNSTVITIMSTSVNLTTSQVDQIGNIYGSHLQPLGNTNYYIAGSSALSNQLASESLSGMVKALVIGIVLSVIIVGIFFRSPVAAFLPLAVFGMSAGISISLNALLYKYVIHGTISFITPTLLLILLLGLSSDYVVYIMSRYRKELRNKNGDAAAVTSRWAGHAVFTSGITVGLSYVVLWLSNVPIFSDSGITNAIGVIIAVLIANTFLIAVMSRGKGKVFWPYKVDNNDHLPAEKSMQKVAHFVINNKGKILVIFLISAIFGTYFYAMTPTNMDVFKLVPSSSGIQAIEVVNNSFHGDFFDRGFIILKFNNPIISNGNYSMSEINAITSVEKKLLDSSQVSQVYGPTYPYGGYVDVQNLSSVSQNYTSEYRAQVNSYIGNDTRYAVIDFQLSSLAYENSASSFVSNLPQLIGNNSNGVTYTSYVGGLTESLNNSYTFTLSSFIKMVPILSLAIFIVLLIQISSLLTPIRLIFMVFASVIISLSLAYLALHFYAGLPILIFLPMFTVITLLAVGLDYDIFMVSRVREEVYKGHTDEEGIRTSITENGGVIITLGTLLFATFGSLAFSGIGIIQEIGIGLGFGVLIDTFISWPFFVPSVMLYLHRYNWWPSKLGRTPGKPKK